MRGDLYSHETKLHTVIIAQEPEGGGEGKRGRERERERDGLMLVALIRSER